MYKCQQVDSAVSILSVAISDLLRTSEFFDKKLQIGKVTFQKKNKFSKVQKFADVSKREDISRWKPITYGLHDVSLQQS